MTVVKVVDASALAALLFGEPEAEAVVGWLRGAQLVAPTLLAFELANVCVAKCRQFPEKRDQLLAAFELRERLGVESVAIDQTSAIELALSTGLTADDASYLLLEQQLGAEIVTLDKQLSRAATSARRRR